MSNFEAYIEKGKDLRKKLASSVGQATISIALGCSSYELASADSTLLAVSAGVLSCAQFVKAGVGLSEAADIHLERQKLAENVT